VEGTPAREPELSQTAGWMELRTEHVGLHDYLAVLRRRWLTVVLTAGAFIALAVLISSAREPAYETSIDLFVLARDADASVNYEASLLAQDRAQTYARLIETRRVAAAVVDDLELSADPRDIAGQISGRADPDSVIVEVTVRDRSPQQAKEIADSIGRVLPPLTRELERANDGEGLSIDIEPLGLAPLPSSPVSPSLSTLVLIGGTIGIVAGLALAMARHAFDPRIRRVDDLADVPAPVIGIVTGNRRRGRPTTEPEDDQSYRLVRLTLARLGADTTRMLITSSGRDKLTTARQVRSLAQAFVDAGDKTKIVDGRCLSPDGAGATLAELRTEDADVVLVDGPPMLTSPDGLLVAAHMSCVLLVVQAGRSRKADARQASEMLTNLGIPLWLLFIERRHGRRTRRTAPRPEPVGPTVLEVDQRTVP
jgi:capsular polysaccharide biosynthesis protein